MNTVNLNSGYKRKQKGVALIIVLWMLSLLTILAAGYSNTMRTETKLTAHLIHSAQAKALAEAGVWQSIAELLRPSNELTWFPDGSTYSYEINNKTVNIRLFDESGKIDLNAAKPELIQNLIESIENTSYEDSLKITDAILDWRDKDTLVRINGAEDEHYEQMGYTYGAKDGNFNTLNELQQVAGVTPEIYRSIKSAITIYSRKATVDKNVAPFEVLSVLPEMDDSSVEEIMQKRNSYQDADGLIGAELQRRFSTAGKTFTIMSEGVVGETKANISAVILLKRHNNKPYTVLSWQEDQALENRDTVEES
jgi:general secretion pathway protein K